MSIKKSVLVTGGAGFIGSHLVDSLLSQKYEVIVLDNFSTGQPQNLKHVHNQITIVDCNLAIQGKWEMYFKDVDWVFHLAALADIVPSIEKPDDYYNSNVNGTFNVLEALKSIMLKKLFILLLLLATGYPMISPPRKLQKSDRNILMRLLN